VSSDAFTEWDVTGRLLRFARRARYSLRSSSSSPKVSGVASPGTPQDYAAFLAAEQAKWSRSCRRSVSRKTRLADRFLLKLKSHKRVSIKEYLTLLEAMDRKSSGNRSTSSITCRAPRW